MYSFYGGPKGKDFEIKRIFNSVKSNRSGTSLEEDLTAGLSSMVGVGELAFVSYGSFSEDKGMSEDYQIRKNLDLEAYGRTFNGTLWKKEYLSTYLNPAFASQELAKNVAILRKEANNEGFSLQELTGTESDTSTEGFCYVFVSSFSGEVPQFSFVNEDDKIQDEKYEDDDGNEITSEGYDILNANEEPYVRVDYTDVFNPRVNVGLPQAQVLNNTVLTTTLNPTDPPRVSLDDTTDINSPQLTFELPRAMNYVTGGKVEVREGQKWQDGSYVTGDFEFWGSNSDKVRVGDYYIEEKNGFIYKIKSITEDGELELNYLGCLAGQTEFRNEIWEGKTDKTYAPYADNGTPRATIEAGPAYLDEESKKIITPYIVAKVPNFIAKAQTLDPDEEVFVEQKPHEKSSILSTFKIPRGSRIHTGELITYVDDAPYIESNLDYGKGDIYIYNYNGNDANYRQYHGNVYQIIGKSESVVNNETIYHYNLEYQTNMRGNDIVILSSRDIEVTAELNDEAIDAAVQAKLEEDNLFSDFELSELRTNEVLWINASVKNINDENEVVIVSYQVGWANGGITLSKLTGSTSMTVANEKVDDSSTSTYSTGYLNANLPKDWQENNEQSGKYIENRTHYTQGNSVTHVVNEKEEALSIRLSWEDWEVRWKNSLEDNNDVDCRLGSEVYSNWDSYVGKKYCVEWNNQLYILENQSARNIRVSNDIFSIVIEPFDEYILCTVSWKEGKIYSCQIVLVSEDYEIRQLDEKYIPNSAMVKDWEENDSTNKKYIQNRTHYKTLSGQGSETGWFNYSFEEALDITSLKNNITVSPITTVNEDGETISGYMYSYSGELQLSTVYPCSEEEQLINQKDSIIKIDGLIMDDDKIIHGWAEDVLFNGIGTGTSLWNFDAVAIDPDGTISISFDIFKFEDNLVNQLTLTSMNVFVEGQIYTTRSSSLKYEYKTLDSDYLPTIEKDWLAVGSDKSYIKNRTHYAYSIPMGVSSYPITGFNWLFGNYSHYCEVVLDMDFKELMINSVKIKFTLEYGAEDDENYQKKSYDVKNISFEGNVFQGSFVDEITGGVYTFTADPMYSDYLVIEVDGIQVFSGPTKITIMPYKTNIKTLDKRYLPLEDIQITEDWNENDSTSSSYIANRTHYSIMDEFEINASWINALALLASNSFNFPYYSSENLQVDSYLFYNSALNSCSIQWGERLYENVPIFIDEYDNITIGASLFSDVPTDIGNYPFQLIFELSSENTYNLTRIIQNGNSYANNCKIYFTGIKKKLDSNYLPPVADWNIFNEESSGYIKNRTHYAQEIEKQEFKKTSNAVTFQSDGEGGATIVEGEISESLLSGEVVIKWSDDENFRTATWTQVSNSVMLVSKEALFIKDLTADVATIIVRVFPKGLSCTIDTMDSIVTTSSEEIKTLDWKFLPTLQIFSGDTLGGPIPIKTRNNREALLRNGNLFILIAMETTGESSNMLSFYEDDTGEFYHYDLWKWIDGIETTNFPIGNNQPLLIATINNKFIVIN